jgi:fermentation-respiration switch protein FrsA (DUF1100 family)
MQKCAPPPNVNYVLEALGLAMPRLARELRPIERIAELRGVEHLQLVYGDQDRFTPASMGERLLAACAPTSRADLWIVPGAKHCQALRVARDEYEQRLVGFFNRSLALPTTLAGRGAFA